MKKSSFVIITIIFLFSFLLIIINSNIVKSSVFSAYGFFDNIDVNRICWDTDVCLQEGTPTWIWLRDKDNTTNRNIRGHGSYWTTFLELAPNAKMIFGYTDIDKYIVYNSNNDEMQMVTDNITFALLNTDFEINSRANSVDHFMRRNSAGTLIYKGSTTSAGHLYDEMRSASNIMINRFRTDGGDQIISSNGADTCIGSGSCDYPLSVTGQGYIEDSVLYDVNNVTVVSGGGGGSAVFSGLNNCMDDVWYNISEVGATPGFNLMFNFTNVNSFRRVHLCVLYEGSSTHYGRVMINNQLLNKEISLRQINTGSVMNCNYFGIDDDTNIINGNGNVMLRIDHPIAGNPSHDINIGCLRLER